MKPVRLDLEAEEELSEAVRWYEKQRPGLGLELLAEVDDAITRSPEWHGAYQLVPYVAPKLGIRRILLVRFPFAVVFIELPEEWRVLAIAHQRRRPGYWIGRLPKG